MPADNPFVGRRRRASRRSGRTGSGTRGGSGSTPRRTSSYVPDVGSTSREEINVVARSGRGANFGWPCFEGTLVFDATATCEGAVAPLLELSARATASAPSSAASSSATRASRRSRAGTCTATSAPGRSRRSRSPAAASPTPAISASSFPGLASFGVDGRLGRVYVTSPPRRRLPARSAARDLSSATQAAARSPSQIGVSST